MVGHATVTLLTALFTALLNQLYVGGGADTSASASADSCMIGSAGIESCLCSVKFGIYAEYYNILLGSAAVGCFIGVWSVTFDYLHI